MIKEILVFTLLILTPSDYFKNEVIPNYQAIAIIRSDYTQVKNYLLSNNWQLKGMNEFQKLKVQTNDTLKGSGPADENFDKYHVETYKFSWNPPEIDTKRTSSGGKWKPKESNIYLRIAYLKSQKKPHAIIHIKREWKYSVRLHVPYTEIPLGRSKTTHYELYKNDVDWLKTITLKFEEVDILLDKSLYDTEIIDKLR